MSGTDGRELGGVDKARRRLLQWALTLPVAAAARPAFAVAAASRGFEDICVINGLGTLFGDDAVLSGADKASAERLANVLATSFPEMVTDRAVGYARASGMTAVNITLGHVEGDVDPFEHTVADIGRWNRILAARGTTLSPILSADDVTRAKAEGKIGVIYGTQNAMMLGDKADRAQLFADLGLRVFQLTYNKSNAIGDGALASGNRGLTPFGRSVVEELNSSGLLIDLSHSGEQTCLDAIGASQKSVIISHTGCRALVDVPRNKTDRELRLLADRGGCVGIYFMPFLAPGGPARAKDVVRHIEHAINLCGEDHVSIGTDGSTTPVPDLAAYLKMQAEYVERRKKAGIAAPGENATAPFFVTDLSGPDQFRELYRLLRARGHRMARIEKILGGNFLRVARDAWGG